MCEYYNGVEVMVMGFGKLVSLSFKYLYLKISTNCKKDIFK